MTTWRAWATTAWALALPCAVQAQPSRQDESRNVVRLHLDGGRAQTAVLAVDADDDDEDGQADHKQSRAIALHDLLRVDAPKAQPAISAEVLEGDVRFVRAGNAIGRRAVFTSEPLYLQSVGPAPARVAFRSGDQSAELQVRSVSLSFVAPDSSVLHPHNASLGISHRITHDRSLPRSEKRGDRSADDENVRVEVRDTQPKARPTIRLERFTSGGHLRSVLRHVRLKKHDGGVRRTAFLRLVGDRTDLSAPGVGQQLLQVALRDTVRAVYRVGDVDLHQDIRVGRPGREGGPRAALRGKLRLRVLRYAPGARAVLGRSDPEAIQLAREQVAVANEIWLQCFIDFGSPADADALIVDPPPSALLSISDGTGLPAQGDGEIRLQAGERTIGPIATVKGAPPEQTALSVARALRAAGFVAEVSVNPRTQFGAGRSADVLVRDRGGKPVRLARAPGKPLSTDSRQRVQVGVVDLSDGVQEFDNMTATSGTLEERTLVKLLADDDPTTIDVFFINRFVAATRQGEAFIEWDGGAIVNTLILDRNGVRFQRQAWVQAHELGHVLLDEPFHPDAVGQDRPWLLMDADARQGRVTGPKRITDAECARVRGRSGPNASPALLQPL